MGQNKPKKLSQKRVKRSFSFIGLVLVLYILFVMFLPYMFRWYVEETNSSILTDETLYYGIHFIIILFGTLIPFFIMRKNCHIKLSKFNRTVKATFVDLFVQTIVFFTICILLTYVSNILISYVGLEGKLISSIGFSYEDNNLGNLLYVFMLIIVAPIIEEYAFRGVLLNCLSRYSKVFALYASAIIFAFAHNNFAEMIPAFAMGIALGKTSLRYKSIQATIVIHILFNAFIYVLCIIPSNIINYVTYGLVAICALAIYFILSGRYEKISLQRANSSSLAASLFFSRFSVILSLVLMIAYTCLVTFIG